MTAKEFVAEYRGKKVRINERCRHTIFVGLTGIVGDLLDKWIGVFLNPGPVGKMNDERVFTVRELDPVGLGIEPQCLPED